MTCPEYAIVAEGLTRTYGPFIPGSAGKVAVDGISFKVRKGEIYGILGPNGAGKTTTIKMLSTMLTPTSGLAEVLGMDVRDGKNIRALRKRINVVSGGERGLYYRLSGRQNLEFFADLYGIPKKDQKALIESLLSLVELIEAADIKVENYSRGMKQRIHIARSLINSPEILFLDEPTIGLDPEISRGIRSLIKKLSDGGTTVILTTHYMFEAEELCDNMVILSRGRIVGKGTVDDIKSSISRVSSLKIITEEDPSDVTASLCRENLDAVTSRLLNERYLTKITLNNADRAFTAIEDLFRPYAISSVGVEEPTLEDAYLTLVNEGL
ncbi:MAG: ATP-binding cassette domain-containing protein [Candidatus Methanoplasma sp.]|jgi:ABC-2 type transport system ATP-binding protein|nr:ATP-binding cassette domain-containing protein [Candidatus Methanoplasma sp.]